MLKKILLSLLIAVFAQDTSTGSSSVGPSAFSEVKGNAAATTPPPTTSSIASTPTIASVTNTTNNATSFGGEVTVGLQGIPYTNQRYSQASDFSNGAATISLDFLLAAISATILLQ